MKTRNLLIASAIVLMLTTASRAADKPVHLFILSGQSNMAGMNLKLGFEPETQKLFPDATVAYIKVAQAGQPIRYWVKQWNEIADKHKLGTKLSASGSKQDFYARILQQYKQLVEKHPKPASVTFCWMQGGRDAREKLSAVYSDALTQLIFWSAATRRRFLF